MEMKCHECGEQYEHDDMSEMIECPNCGFNEEKCSHPQSYRTEREIYSVDEGKYVKELVCEKCGAPLN